MDLAKAQRAVAAAKQRLAEAQRSAEGAEKLLVAQRAVEAAEQELEEARRAGEGELTYNDRRTLVEDAITDRMKALTGASYCWIYVADMTDTWAVYRTDGDATWQVDYTIADDGTVTISEPVEVRRVSTYEQVDGQVAAEAGPVVATDRVVGHVLEAAKVVEGASDAAGRLFKVRIIAYGDSKNRRRYPEAVLRAATPLYEGSKAYDHHRTDAELETSTVQGLVGTYRNVVATAEGLEADLHVLPSAVHVAEALDQSLANQADGLDPLVGFSQDAICLFKPITDSNGDRLMEATQILSVLSADVVADPAAGGQPTRAVAGGIHPPNKETSVPKTAPEGQTTEPVGGAATATIPDKPATPAAPAAATEATAPAPATRATEATEATEATFTKGGLMTSMAINTALGSVADPELRAKLAESVAGLLPDRFTESDITAAAKTVRDLAGRFEVAGLAPSVPGDPTVTKDAQDRKVEAFDKMLAGDPGGYRSLKEAFRDITGHRAEALSDEDENRAVLRAVRGQGRPFASTGRAPEAVTSTTFDVITGDSITRRMIALYNLPQLQSWRRIVSDIVPINDFRTQRRDRMGGYGLLPVVQERAPYQPLITPGDEEATYQITKKGGTEDLTLEAIANDDLRAIQQIPVKLARAASQTLYRFVWDMLLANATCTYDATALFHANHANTDAASPLSQTTLGVARRKMAVQAAFGDAVDVLFLAPRFLIVPAALQELAYMLTTSAVAIPATPAGASNTPNINQGLEPIVLPYATDENDWFSVADPQLVPTIEVGFYQGRQEPELFVQDDPNQGSWFDADVVTYKIRHIYSGTILDHRGFYRGVG